MLRHLQANGDVITAFHLKRLAQIRAGEALGRDKQLRTVDIFAVESTNCSYAQFLESPEPSTSPAAHIEDAGGSKEPLHEREYDPR